MCTLAFDSPESAIKTDAMTSLLRYIILNCDSLKTIVLILNLNICNCCSGAKEKNFFLHYEVRLFSGIHVDLCNFLWFYSSFHLLLLTKSVLFASVDASLVTVNSFNYIFSTTTRSIEFFNLVISYVFRCVGGEGAETCRAGVVSVHDSRHVRSSRVERKFLDGKRLRRKHGAHGRRSVLLQT